MGFRFFIAMTLSLLTACATRTTKNASWEKLWSQVRMQGEGKARLEIPPESWVFSFESVLKQNDWIMAISIPLKGEEMFAFPGLNRAKPEVTPAADDFRWQVVQALREASHKRRLAYPQLGQEFVTYLHHLLRWVNAESLGLKRECVAVANQSQQWSCTMDKITSQWSWNEAKAEFVGNLPLREGWRMQIVFKNLTDSVFKRATLEIIRDSESSSFTELRQEFFFN